MNISSIVVKTTQAAFDDVERAIMGLQSCEIYLKDRESSHIIVVIEAANAGEEMALNKYLETLEGVMSANMHYTYQENELNAQLRAMQDGGYEFLNDDSIPAEHIAYSGSIAHIMAESLKHKH